MKATELLDLAKLGNDAETIKRAFSGVLSNELDLLLSQLATPKHDASEYAFIAGQIFFIKRLMKTLDLSIQEGKEAVAELK